MSTNRVNYMEGFRTIVVQPYWVDDVRETVKRVVENRATYEKVERNTGIPWVYVAAVHYRESGCDFSRQILNGEPYTQETRLVPSGHGPWDSWWQSTIHALRLKHHPLEHGLHDVETMLPAMEAWNGWGYRRQGINSPYLWTGSQYGEGVGKYVADGNYSPTAQDKQVGAAVIVHELMARGHWAPTVSLYNLPIMVDADGSMISERGMRFQEALNLALADTLVQPLLVDGWVGRKTQTALAVLTGMKLPGGE